jgi:hypothetical protein
VSKSAVVHCQTALIVVDVVGSMWIILFALTGRAVEVLIGNMLLATIHVVAKTFLTALFVFSTNLLDFLVFVLDSIEFSCSFMKVYNYYGKIYSLIYCYIFYLKSQGLLKITCYFRDFFYK